MTERAGLILRLVLLTSVVSGTAFAQHPISEEIRVAAAGLTVRPGEKFSVPLAVVIPSLPTTWHLYSITQAPGGPIRTVIRILPELDFRVAGKIVGTEPESVDDPIFGIVTETYTDSAIFAIPVVSNPSSTGRRRLVVSIYYQTCNDKICLPPREDTLGVDVLFAGAPAANVAWVGSAPAPTPPASPKVADAPNATGARDSSSAAVASSIPDRAVATRPISYGAPVLPGNGSLALFLWIAATMGALSLLTPCVFPMVPITISYFSRGESRGRSQALRDATVYAGGIVTAFTALGLGLALVLGATGLNRFAANPWLNLAIAALFGGFALSLFGVVDLTVPGSFLTRIDGAIRASRFGRDGTTLLMGATFALTSFTCTAPFVGTLLVSATQGNWKWPMLGLLTFSTVFALPFLILALVPEALARLPRSGEWMITLKGVLAFLELAAAMKFLSNADLVQGWGIFTRNVVLATWVILGVGLVAYLVGARLGKLGFSRARAHVIPALLAAGIVGWLARGLTGHRLGEMEPFLPPASNTRGGAANGNELTWMIDSYDAAVAQARAEGKEVLVDFTGYTCTNCRWMEANMFPRDDVRRQLERFVRVRLFTDGRDTSNVLQQALEQRMFSTVALPLYAVISPTGAAPRHFLGMTRNANEFIDFLAGGPTPNR